MGKLVGKGFYVKAISRHNNISAGCIIYIKAVEFKNNSPTLYAILDVENGLAVGSVTANELKNRFEIRT